MGNGLRLAIEAIGSSNALADALKIHGGRYINGNESPIRSS
jgi:hypothetical protein